MEPRVSRELNGKSVNFADKSWNSKLNNGLDLSVASSVYSPTPAPRIFAPIPFESPLLPTQAQALTLEDLAEIKNPQEKQENLSLNSVADQSSDQHMGELLEDLAMTISRISMVKIQGKSQAKSQSKHLKQSKGNQYPSEHNTALLETKSTSSKVSSTQTFEPLKQLQVGTQTSTQTSVSSQTFKKLFIDSCTQTTNEFCSTQSTHTQTESTSIKDTQADTIDDESCNIITQSSSITCVIDSARLERLLEVLASKIDDSLKVLKTTDYL